jgi:hypothetical protein
LVNRTSDLAVGARVRQIVHVTSPGTNELSAEQPFRPRRPNAHPVPGWQETEDVDPSSFLDGVLRERDDPAIADGPPPWGVRARLRNRVYDVPMVLALTTLLVLVAAAIWVGTQIAPRDETRKGGAGRVPAVAPTAQASGSPVASPPPSVAPSVAPSAAAPTAQPTAVPVAPQPSRPRTTPPPSRAVRATVDVVDDRGGAFQFGVVINNTAATAQSWELVITFPVPVTDLRAIGTGDLTVRPNQVIVRGRSGPGESGLAIGGRTSNGSQLRTWTCTINGQPC